MVQDIAPWILQNEFVPDVPERQDDLVLDFTENGLLLDSAADTNRSLENTLPDLRTWRRMQPPGTEPCLIHALRLVRPPHDGIPQRTLVFRIAVHATKPLEPPAETRLPVRDIRFSEPPHLRLAALTGLHLHRWYSSTRFCRSCGARLVPSDSERALACRSCGNVEYPAIFPCIIAAVADGDNLLLTTARSGTKQYALISGFIEIGETAEQAVRREVLEETGILVKNIRYRDSQPWAPGSALMLGYTAEADGRGKIRIQESELSSAAWVHRSKIPFPRDTSSLTMRMIADFALGSL